MIRDVWSTQSLSFKSMFFSVQHHVKTYGSSFQMSFTWFILSIMAASTQEQKTLVPKGSQFSTFVCTVCQQSAHRHSEWMWKIRESNETQELYDLNWFQILQTMHLKKKFLFNSSLLWPMLMSVSGSETISAGANILGWIDPLCSP